MAKIKVGVAGYGTIGQRLECPVDRVLRYDSGIGVKV